MKCVGLLVLFLSVNMLVFTQVTSKYKYSNYRLKIDSLQNEGLLNKNSLENMHGCGGAVDGYYYKNQLVLIESRYGAEVGGTGQKAYLEDSIIVEFEYFEEFQDWNLNEAYAYDTISADFVGQINFAMISYQIVNDEYKLVYSEGKIQGIPDYEKRSKQLLSCINMMQKSLFIQKH